MTDKELFWQDVKIHAKAMGIAFVFVFALLFAMYLITVRSIDHTGDTHCALGDWRGEKVCPRDRAVPPYGKDGKWNFELSKEDQQ